MGYELKAVFDRAMARKRDVSAKTVDKRKSLLNSELRTEESEYSEYTQNKNTARYSKNDLHSKKLNLRRKFNNSTIQQLSPAHLERSLERGKLKYINNYHTAKNSVKANLNLSADLQLDSITATR